MSTEIAHAYISISPNMQGFFSDLSRTLSSSSTTSAISTSLSAAIDKADFASSASKAGADFSVTFGDKLKSGLSAATVAAGNILSSGFSKAVSTLTSGVGKGIEAADTFRNYGLVLQSLGYSGEQASSVINTLSDRLLGLPTASSDMIKQIQVLTATLGDLDKATGVGLAFNDMLLAAGASYEDTQNSQRMFNKMLASGEYNALRWQSIMEVMPGQLKQLSEHMLGAGNDGWALGNALKAGTVSMDDMLNAMVELDTDGTGAFENFEQQARAATGGIGTALTNFQTRIGNGWRAIIEAIGVPQIAATIDSVSTGIRKFLVNLAEPIAQFAQNVGFDTWADKITAAFERVNGAVNFLVSGGIQKAASAFLASVPGFDSFMTAISRVRGIVETFASMFLIKIAPIQNGLHKLMAVFNDIGKSLGSHVSKMFEELGQAINGLVPNMTSLQPTMQAFGKAVEGVAQRINGGFKFLIDVLRNVRLAFRTFMGSEWDTSPLTAVVEKVKAIGEALKNFMANAQGAIGSAMSGLQAAFKSTMDFARTFASGLFDSKWNVTPIANFNDRVVALGQTLRDLAGGALSGISGAFAALGSAFTQIYTSSTPLYTAWDLLKSAASSLVSTVQGAFTTLQQHVQNTFLVLNYNVAQGIASFDQFVNGIRLKVNEIIALLKIENLLGEGSGMLAITAGFGALGAAVDGLVGHLAKINTVENPVGKIGQAILKVVPGIQTSLGTVGGFVEGFTQRILGAWDLMNKGILASSGAGAIMQSVRQGGVFQKVGTSILQGASELESAWLQVSGKIAAGVESIRPQFFTKFESIFGESALAGIKAGMGKVTAVIEPLLTPVANAMSSLGSKVKVAFQGITHLPFLEPLMAKLPTLGIAFGGASSGALSFVKGLMNLINPVQMVISSFITMVATNEDFRNRVGEVVSSIGSNLVPIFQTLGTTLLNIGQAVIPPIMAAFDTLTPIFAEIGLLVLQVVDALLPLINMLLQQLSPVLTTIAGAIGNLINAVMPIVQTVLSTIISGLQTLLPVVTTVLQFIITIIGTVINVVGNVIAVVISVVSGIISAVQPVVAFIGGVVETVISVIGTVITTVVGIVSTIAGVVGSIISTVSGFIGSVVNFLSGLVNTITSGVANLFGSVTGKVSEIFGNVTGTVSNLVSTVLDTVGSIPDKIVGFFSNAGSLLVNAGSSIINGLIDGVTGALGGLWDTVSGIGQKIIDLKGPPSYDKIMLVENGELIMQGLVQGIKNGRPYLESELRSISDSISVTPRVAAFDGMKAYRMNDFDLRGMSTNKAFENNEGDTYNVYLNVEDRNDFNAMAREFANAVATQNRLSGRASNMNVRFA